MPCENCISVKAELSSQKAFMTELLNGLFEQIRTIGKKVDSVEEKVDAVDVKLEKSQNKILAAKGDIESGVSFDKTKSVTQKLRVVEKKLTDSESKASKFRTKLEQRLESLEGKICSNASNQMIQDLEKKLTLGQLSTSDKLVQTVNRLGLSVQSYKVILAKKIDGLELSVRDFNWILADRRQQQDEFSDGADSPIETVSTDREAVSIQTIINESAKRAEKFGTTTSLRSSHVYGNSNKEKVMSDSHPTAQMTLYGRGGKQAGINSTSRKIARAVRSHTNLQEKHAATSSMHTRGSIKRFKHGSFPADELIGELNESQNDTDGTEIICGSEFVNIEEEKGLDLSEVKTEPEVEECEQIAEISLGQKNQEQGIPACRGVVENLKQQETCNKSNALSKQKMRVACNLCGAIFGRPDSSTTGNHALLHLNLTPYQCTVCHAAFKTRYNAQKHIVSVHPDLDWVEVIFTANKPNRNQLLIQVRKCFE